MNNKPIAIVGMACRFPGNVSSPDQFWDLLSDGRNVITSIGRDRWNTDFYYHPDPKEPGRTYTWAAGVIDGLEKTDADFFGITPREAGQIDPQQWMLMEMAWEALENGGHKPKDIAGSDTAVFVGVSSMDYITSRTDDPSVGNAYFMTGGTMSIVANRLSYIFDIHGPSMSIDTACSSSVVALNEACQAIWSGASSMALCGGVGYLGSPFPFIGFSRASMLSKKGHCLTFGDDADGYVRAEGGAVLLLKPLDQAEADGDTIHAVIRAVQVNSDGHTNGLSLPSSDAQSDLLKSVYKSAGVSPKDISFLEAHGTGTLVGDPIEVGAIGQAVGVGRPSDKPLLIGSVKSNIGHLEAASGMAGIMKAIQVLKRRTIPPLGHQKELNHNIDFDSSNVHVVRELMDLPVAKGKPAIVGVNSFGFGGTNAHVILEEYRPKKTRAQPSKNKAKSSKTKSNYLQPLSLSARSPEALAAMAKVYSDFLENKDADAYYHIAHTRHFHRDALSHRMAVVAKDVDALREQLDAFSEGEQSDGVAVNKKAANDERLALVFSGNGCQWQGMGVDLLKVSPVFLSKIREIDKLFSRDADWSIEDELRRPASKSRLERTEYAQPTLFAVQVGTLAVLNEMGLRPDAVVGHSVGEVAAAYCSGALTLARAVKVIHQRSLAQAKTRGVGKMAAVGISEKQAEALVAHYNNRIEIAGVNSADSVTLSGDEKVLKELEASLQSHEIFVRLLDLDYSFHSPAMDPIKDDIITGLKGLKPRASSIRFLSTVTGGDFPGERLGAEYWWDNIRKPVQFGPVLETLLDEGFVNFLEVGAHPVLQIYVRESMAARKVEGTVLPTLKRNTAGEPALRESICQLINAGCGLDSARIYPYPAQRASLPNYPWQREDHRADETGDSFKIIRGAPDHPLLGYRRNSAQHVWDNVLDNQAFAYLNDHQVDGTPVFPASGFIEMALAACQQNEDGQHNQIEGLAIYRPIVLMEGQSIKVQFSQWPDDGTFKIKSAPRLNDVWSDNVAGRIGRHTQDDAHLVRDLEAIRQRLRKNVSAKDHYKLTEQLGISYGPAFQGLKSALVGPSEGLAELVAPKAISGDMDEYILHPSIVDSGLQLLFQVAAANGALFSRQVFLPTRFERIRVFGDTHDIKYVHVDLKKISTRSILATFCFMDADGNVLAELENSRFSKARLRHNQGKNIDVLGHVLSAKPHPNIHYPSPLLKPGKLAQRIKRYIPDLIEQLHRRSHYEELQPLSDAVALSVAYSVVSILSQGETSFTTEQLMEMGNIQDPYETYINFLLKILKDEEFITKKDDVWTFADTTDLPNPMEVWRLVVADHPDHLPEVLLAGRLLTRLPDILRGGFDPAELLTPEGGDTTLSHYYDNSATFTLIHSMAHKAFTEIIDKWPEGRQLRILEIGGGMGGLTNNLVSAVATDNCSYLFTDKDEAHVSQSKSRFHDVPFISFEELDIEGDLSAQEFSGRQFDIIVASSVFHLLDDLPKAFNNIKSLLATNGMMILIDRQPDWLNDLVVGVQENWWLHSPTPDAPVSRFLPQEAWSEILTKTGFEDVQCIAEQIDDIPPESFMLLARNPANQADVPDQQAEDIRDWLILSDPNSKALVNDLAKELRKASHHVVTVCSGDAFECISNDEYRIAPNDPAGFEQLIKELRIAGFRFDRTVHMMGLSWDDDVDVNTTMSIQELRCSSTMFLTQTLDAARIKTNLTLVTGGAVPLPSGGGAIVPSQAALWGFGRVVANEFPQFGCRMIDVHPQSSIAATRKLLLPELQYVDADAEVVLDKNQRYITNYQHTDINVPDRGLISSKDKNTAVRLDFERPGKLTNLNWFATPRKKPAANGVEIEVKATGLNFRDIMWTMGLLPEEAVESGYSGPSLGLECAGIITAVGEGVDQYKVGDEVIAFASSCFSSHINADVRSVMHKPKTLSFQEGATIPSAFFTVYYALNHLAHLSEGETILIHGAAGGVGIAAIQYAVHCGATVIATAGTDEKREFLKFLGVDHVLNSRSLDFADHVMTLTHGKGVDVVLNSLAGEAIAKNMQILRPFGRFLELGKRDFYLDSRLGMRPFRNNITYFGIDADQLMAVQPDLATRMFTEMMELFKQGVFRPPVYRVFSQTRVVDAFRHMQSSKHIGKIVVAFNGDAIEPNSTGIRHKKFKARKDGTYLITGGLGDLGLATAKWLASNGAGGLILIGRRGIKNKKTRAAVDAMIAGGTNVQVFKASVTDAEKMGEAIAMCGKGKELPPLRGVIHSAMVLDDGLIKNMTTKTLNRVLEPKIAGTAILDKLTQSLKLDFFVMYSSVTTSFGNPGQANYVAANMYMESVAQSRRSKGLPGTAVCWGPISDIGVFARTETQQTSSIIKRICRTELTSTHALELLGRLLSSNHPAVITFANLDWRVVRHAISEQAFTRFRSISGDISDDDMNDISLDELQDYVRSMPFDGAVEMILTRLVKELSKLVGIAEAKFDLERPIVELGLDSLMSLELALSIEESFGVEPPPMLIANGSNFIQLAEFIVNGICKTNTGEDEDATEQDTDISVEAKQLAMKHGVSIEDDDISQLINKLQTQPKISKMID